MIIGVLKKIKIDESRVALLPVGAGFWDELYAPGSDTNKALIIDRRSLCLSF
jgi:hypothetical protein